MGLQWVGNDGDLDSKWLVPAPNCCIFYDKTDFEGNTTRMCYDEETGEGKADKIVNVLSLDCGSKTYATIGLYDPKSQTYHDKFAGTAGRVSLAGR